MKNPGYGPVRVPYVVHLCILCTLPVCLKRYTRKNCDLVNEKTGDVKLLSVNFSQEAHQKAFLITLYELFVIGYHHK